MDVMGGLVGVILVASARFSSVGQGGARRWAHLFPGRVCLPRDGGDKGRGSDCGLHGGVSCLTQEGARGRSARRLYACRI